MFNRPTCCCIQTEAYVVVWLGMLDEKTSPASHAIHTFNTPTDHDWSQESKISIFTSVYHKGYNCYGTIQDAILIIWLPKVHPEPESEKIYLSIIYISSLSWKL